MQECAHSDHNLRAIISGAYNFIELRAQRQIILLPYEM